MKLSASKQCFFRLPGRGLFALISIPMLTLNSLFEGLMDAVIKDSVFFFVIKAVR